MKTSHLLLGGALLAATFTSAPTMAAPAAQPASTADKWTVTPLKTQRLLVQVQWRERFRMLPGATAHVALVAELPNGETLPLATGVKEVSAGSVDVALMAPKLDLGQGAKLRLRAWIIREGRVMMQSLAPATYLNDLSSPVTMMMRFFPSGKPVQNGKPVPLPRPVSDSEYKLQGQVSKLDRRGLSPEAKVVVELRDVSLADAPSKLLGETTIELAGRQLPVAYDMLLVGFDLKPNGRYAVSAKVIEDGKTSYLTDTHFGFDGSKKEQTVDVRVVPAR